MARVSFFHFHTGAFVELQARPGEGPHLVEFIDRDRGELVHAELLHGSGSVRTRRRWFVNYLLRVTHALTREVLFEQAYEPAGRRVGVVLTSKALGDNLAWMPYVEEFGAKHGCQMVCSTFYNDLFREAYPDIEFFEPGQLEKASHLYAGYRIDVFPEDAGRFERCPVDHRAAGVQRVASSVLGLEHQERRPRVQVGQAERPVPGRYVCIAVQSTAQSKYWNNPSGWQETVAYLKSRGYEVVCIDEHPAFGGDGMLNTIPEGSVDRTGAIDLRERAAQIAGCEFFMGLSSGLAWLAWALHKPVVLISGFTDPRNEFHTPYRVINRNVCNSCANDVAYTFDNDDWSWCPRHARTRRMFECTRQISFEMVKVQIDRILAGGAPSAGPG